MVQRIRLWALREHRLGKGWNLETLAATAKVGIDLTRQGDDGSPITRGTARKLAAAVGVPIEILEGQISFL